MKGLISKSLLTLCCVSGVVAAQGCYSYRDLVDPCYPQRYEYAARQEVNDLFGAQVNNGHILDQTVWSYHFESGSDKLTPGGMDKLDTLARRRPAPDPMVFLQTAQDIAYSANAADKFTTDRNALDTKRIQAIQHYLNSHTAGRSLVFQVAVHDPGEVGISATPVQQSISRLNASSVGTLPSGGGGGGGASASGGAGAR